MSNEDSKKVKSKNEEWFEFYVDRLENHSIREEKKENVNYKCPCCGFKTLDERGGYDICNVCFWEDDGQDEEDADIIRGGPNGSLSLTQARANFLKFAACEERFIKNVRKPLPEEY